MIRIARRLAGALALCWCATAPGADRAPADGSAYPPPAGPHEVRLVKSVMMPMRDGIHLATDLYFPQTAGEPKPVILIRTPYGKKGWREEGRAGPVTRMFASHGYVVAVQDKRGRFESEGLYTPAIREDLDGYDSIEWLSKQEWSNGKVGTYGCSDLGDAQVWAASARHPNHAAMIPQASGSSIGAAGNRYRYFGSYNGGAFHLGPGASWMVKSGSKVFLQRPQWLARERFREFADHFAPEPVHAPKDIDLGRLLWTLPTVELMHRAGIGYTDWEDFQRHGLDDPWWRQFPYYDGDEEVDVPALFVNSWHDFGVNETLFLFDYFRERASSKRARDNQFVIISPATHCDSELLSAPTVVGERDFGDARRDFWSLYLRWFALWLKGEANGVNEMPRVQYFVMGRNEWRSAGRWPPPGTRFRKFYLRSTGAANSRYGDGALSTEPPGAEPADTYVYDPGSPVPSGSGPYGLGEGFFDQRAIEMREDVLVYTSAPLERGLEIGGPVSARLYVSSSARDTDFTAKLVDVYPDGRAFYLQEGILRSRYREGFDRKVWMQEGETYPLDISLDATSNYFPAGHRIRLEVSSSNFPRFDRNLNTGGNNFDESEWVIARNAIHHSAATPSHLVLPVVPQP